MERWVFFEVKWLSEMGFGVAMTAAMMMDEMDVFGRILDDAANPGSGGSGGMSIALMEPPRLVGAEVWGVGTFQCSSLLLFVKMRPIVTYSKVRVGKLRVRVVWLV